MCSRTNIPQVPGMTQQEQDALAAQRSNIEQMQTMGGNYGSILQAVSGLFNPDGTINQNALQNFGQQVQGYQSSQQGIYGTALQQAQLEDQLYRQALSGTGPVSEGLKQQKAQDFKSLKEAAGRRGIRITGDSFENATSDSTAGIRMISEMGKRYDLAADNERQALRQWGSTQALNRMGSLASFDPNAGQMGYLNQATVGMLPVLSGINEGWSAYSQPFYNQRMAEFNRNSAQAQADAQWKNSMWSGAGQLAGTAASMWGMGKLAGAMGGSTMVPYAASSMTSPLSLYGKNPYQYSMGSMGGH